MDVACDGTRFLCATISRNNRSSMHTFQCIPPPSRVTRGAVQHDYVSKVSELSHTRSEVARRQCWEFCHSSLHKPPCTYAGRNCRITRMGKPLQEVPRAKQNARSIMIIALSCPTRHTPSHYNMEVSRGVPIATWTCGQCARTVPNPYAKTPHPTVLDHHRPSSTIPTLEGMAGWFSWVSGKRDNKNTARDAIIGLREQLHLIAKKEEHLQTKIDEELRKAKDNVTSNKRGTFEAWDSRLGN